LLDRAVVSILILLNAGAGTAARVRTDGLRDRLQQACAELGLEAVVRAVEAARLTQAVEQAAADDAVATVVMGGGDGTLNTAANVLVPAGKAMGVLPMGTLNHFARDLGIPPGLDDALRVIAAGRTRRVDVGDVNGRVFLNNCSIGLYVDAVRQRERLRALHGWEKWSAMARGAWEALRRFRVFHLTLRFPWGEHRLSTPQLVVANNEYETRLLALGQRTRLDAGRVCVYSARHRGRFGFVRLVLKALVGRLRDEKDFEAVSTHELEILERRTRRRIFLAVDGELGAMPSPLRFVCRPGALTVVAPP
jgi:diacylglycerol kinase family enzyme